MYGNHKKNNLAYQRWLRGIVISSLVVGGSIVVAPYVCAVDKTMPITGQLSDGENGYGSLIYHYIDS